MNTNKLNPGSVASYDLRPGNERLHILEGR